MSTYSDDLGKTWNKQLALIEEFDYSEHSQNGHHNPGLWEPFTLNVNGNVSPPPLFQFVSLQRPENGLGTRESLLHLPPRLRRCLTRSK